MPFETLTECLQARASSDARALAFQFHDGSGRAIASFTFATLDARARTLAASLVERGAAGQHVVLTYGPGLEFVAAFFACQYAGAVAVPAYPPDPQRPEQSLTRLAYVIADAGAGIVLTDRRLLTSLDRLDRRGQAASWLGAMPWPACSLLGGNWQARLQRLGRMRRPVLPDVQWVATDDIPTRPDIRFNPASIARNKLAYLQYTSGSTSRPRGVCLTQANVLANIAMAARLISLDRHTIGAGWVPLYHDLGLVCHVIAAVVIGFPSHLMSPQDFLRRPLSWLELISQLRATHGGAPNFAYQLCVRKSDPASRRALDLRSWRVAGNGGEPLRTATLEQFCKAFADQGFRPAAFMPTYGAAEATLFIASGKPPGRAAKILHADPAALAQHRIQRIASDQSNAVPLVGHGRTGAAHELRIVKPGTLDPVPDGHVGEILFRGPSVAAGYHGTEAEIWPFGQRLSTSPALSESVEPLFFRTGDLGCILEGELYITGRYKDLMIVQGRNLYPGDIELSVEASHADLRPGCSAVFSVPGEATECVVVVAEVFERRLTKRDGSNEIIKKIMRHVASEHDVRVHRVVLLPAHCLPKTSSGKVQRSLTRESLEQGLLSIEADFQSNGHAQTPGPSTAVVSVKREAEVLTLLHEVVRKRIVSDDLLSSMSFDSLAIIEVMEVIGARTGVDLDKVELFACLTPADLTRLIESHTDFKGWQPLDVSASEDARRLARSAARQPASATQRLFWDMNRLLPGSYRSHVLLELKGVLDEGAIEQAWSELLEDNAVLRACYGLQADQLNFSILQGCTAPIEWVDAQGWHAARVKQAITARVRCPFDLAAPPLARCTVYRMAATDSLLQLVVHQVAVDQWSFSRLIEDLLRRNAAIVSGVSARRRFMALPITKSEPHPARPVITSVPGLAPLPATGSLLYSTGVKVLSSASVGRLQERARQWHVSLHAVLLSAYFTALAAHTGRAALRMVVPMTTRSAATLDVSGPMMHFLPLDLIRHPDASEKLSARQVADRLGEAFEQRLQAYEFTPDGSDFPDVHFNFHDFDKLRLSERLKSLHLGRSVTWAGLDVSMQTAADIGTVSPVAVGMTAVLIKDEMTLWLTARPDVMTREDAFGLMQSVLRILEVCDTREGLIDGA